MRLTIKYVARVAMVVWAIEEECRAPIDALRGAACGCGRCCHYFFVDAPATSPATPQPNVHDMQAGSCLLHVNTALLHALLQG
jgi:hypothetical protein